MSLKTKIEFGLSSVLNIHFFFILENHAFARLGCIYFAANSFCQKTYCEVSDFVDQSKLYHNLPKLFLGFIAGITYKSSKTVDSRYLEVQRTL